MKQAWLAELKRFEQPNLQKAVFQIVNTLIPYLGILVMMYLTISWKVHYGITILLALPASLFLVWLFIFFHDCAHGSYVASRRANKVLGTVLGTSVFMPFFEWRSLHVAHHATSGNLDSRGKGDIWTMTVDEYNHSPRFRRLLYRMARNPVVMLGLGPLYIFLIAHRLPSRGANREAVVSVVFMNASLVAIIIAAAFTISIRVYIMIQLPIIFMAGAVGVWLFRTGVVRIHGIQLMLLFGEALSISCRNRCSGYQETSDFIISITSGHEFPITIWSNVRSKRLNCRVSNL